MFNIGDYVVCPGHGVGRVEQIDDKCLGNETFKFYNIKLISSGLKVMVPVESGANSVRSLVVQSDVEKLFAYLKDHDFEPDMSTWNRRQREYLSKVKTGDLLEIADVIKSLYIISGKKGLSFGEKKMLSHCKELLAEELSCVLELPRNSVQQNIDDCFNGQTSTL